MLPRENIQNNKGRAKTYQVKQVLLAINKIKGRIQMNIEHYTYRVTWSPEDNEHVGLCVQLPSLS